MGIMVTYVGGFAGGVEIAETGQLVGQSETVEVDDTVAGTAPSGDDLGSGLLAQPANWAPAKKASARKGEG